MSTWSGRVLGAAAWVAVVAVSAVLVWAVISRAGAGLVSASGPVPTGTVRPDTVAEGAPGGATDTTTPGTTPERRGTWEGEAGVVTATCRGSAVSLVGAQPEEHRVVQVVDPGPDHLVVAFREDGREPVTVIARCQDGRPDFSVSRTVPSPGTPAPTPSGSGGDDSGGPGGGSDSGSDDGREG